MKYIMSIDQGTTSCRAIIFDKDGMPVSSAQKEFAQFFPKPGWVEHDPTEIWSTQIGVAQEAMLRARASFRDIVAMGVTNQRETTIIWDKTTGEPVYNAIVWQCRRTAAYSDALINEGLMDFFRERTGLTVDAYFSATKIKWILDNVDGAREKADRGTLAFGTVETWLIWMLTKGKVHVTDYSNASRTMLFNIHELQWDREILDLLHIPEAILPEVKPSSYVYGVSNADIFGGEIPIAGAAGDQQAALFGQTCFSVGDVKNTYGTGCFLLMNTGLTPVRSNTGLLTTIAWGIDGVVEYALEGSVFVAGAAVQWLRDELRFIDAAADSEAAANSVEDTAGVYVAPAFVGLGAPYWDPHARGAITGLTRGAGKNHIIRATLESIAYQTVDLVRAMELDSGAKLNFLRADGGASANNFLMQFQADIIEARVKRPACLEITALGAAYLAGLATGYWSSRDELFKNLSHEDEFKPAFDREKVTKLMAGWHRAVASIRTGAD